MCTLTLLSVKYVFSHCRFDSNSCDFEFHVPLAYNAKHVFPLFTAITIAVIVCAGIKTVVFVYL